MSEPKRLLDAHDSSPEERALLQSALGELPSDASKQRLLTALGLPVLPSASALGDGANHAEKVLTNGARGLKGKLLLLGMVVGTASLAVLAYVATRSHESARAPQQQTSQDVAPPYDSRVASSSVQEPQAVRVDSLAREVALLDETRVELARSNAQGALTTLDRYESAHALGVLREEAGLLRIEALAQRSRQLARAEATRFFARYPATPHRARIEALLTREHE